MSREICRSIWAWVHHRRVFDDADAFRHVRHYRDNAKYYDAFEVDDASGSEPDAADIDTDAVAAEIARRLELKSTTTITNLEDYPNPKELKASTKLEVIGTGTQKLTIHTSCSKDLNVGDEFGSLKLVELTTTEGGTVTDEVTPVEFLDECELPEAPAGDVRRRNQLPA